MGSDTPDIWLGRSTAGRSVFTREFSKHHLTGNVTSLFFSSFFRLGGPLRLFLCHFKLSFDVFERVYLECNSSSTLCRWKNQLLNHFRLKERANVLVYYGIFLQTLIDRVECGMILESGSNSTHYSYFYNSYITHFRGVRSYNLNYCEIFTFQRPFQITTIFSRNRVERNMLQKTEPTSSQRDIPFYSTNN